MSREQGGRVVLSGLPLIMVKGNFKSVFTMTIEELETFIPFMTMCSIQRAGAELTPSGAPKWWTNSLRYTFPLQKPEGMSPGRYRTRLANIVCQCYHYHQQLYILHFCDKVVTHSDSFTAMPNSDDNTTSLFCSSSGTHILTYNNQNREYDKMRNDTPKPPRRCLLPYRPTRIIQEICLCENCGSGFDTQAAFNAHERVCYHVSEDPAVESENINCSDLLGYLQLSRKKPPSPPKRRLEISLLKNRLVEFSSFLGRRILAEAVGKRDAVSKPDKLVQAYEAYCFISPRTTKARDSYEFRPGNKTFVGSSSQSADFRTYCFTRSERKERYKTLKTGLNKRSRDLLRSCRKCSVRLIRLKPPPPPRTPSPEIVDLCSSDDEPI